MTHNPQLKLKDFFMTLLCIHNFPSMPYSVVLARLLTLTPHFWLVLRWYIILHDIFPKLGCFIIWRIMELTAQLWDFVAENNRVFDSKTHELFQTIRQYVMKWIALGSRKYRSHIMKTCINGIIANIRKSKEGSNYWKCTSGAT